MLSRNTKQNFVKEFFESSYFVIFSINIQKNKKWDIRDIEKERETLYNKALEVDGQKEALDEKIKSKKRDKQKQLDIATAAQKQGMAMELANATRQASRL